MRFLKRILKDKLSDEELSQLYSSFDIIGDIAILRIPETLDDKKLIIAKAILDNFKSIKVVLKQASPIRGELRLRDLEYLAGEPRFITLYKEHNCLFKVDLEKVYFSPRLSHERIRIASSVKEGECIVNMFGGIGTYSIVIAKHKKVKRIYSIDINPHCYTLALENVRLNKVQDIVIPLLGDVRNLICELKGISDRVLMPYPAEAKNFFPYALSTLKDKGVIHYYTEVKARNREEALRFTDKEIDFLVNANEIICKIILKRIVREVGPRVYHTVSDLNITKRK
ncbi:MAG: class I SAM-dependent methyltransferase family protein [Nitrososphaerales archaeon]